MFITHLEMILLSVTLPESLNDEFIIMRFDWNLIPFHSS